MLDVEVMSSWMVEIVDCSFVLDAVSFDTAALPREMSRAPIRIVYGFLDSERS
jgi:hypothetical protein